MTQDWPRAYRCRLFINYEHNSAILRVVNWPGFVCRPAHVELPVAWKAYSEATDAPAQMAQPAAAGQALTNGKRVAAGAATIVDDREERL